MTKRPEKPAPLSMADWKAERTRIKQRRARRLRNQTIAMIAGLTALTATIIVIPRPIFVWNVSASAITGLYFVSGRSGLERGDMAALWLPPRARRLAAERRYLPQNIAAITAPVVVCEKLAVFAAVEGLAQAGSPVNVDAEAPASNAARRTRRIVLTKRLSPFAATAFACCAPSARDLAVECTLMPLKINTLSEFNCASREIMGALISIHLT